MTWQCLFGADVAVLKGQLDRYSEGRSAHKSAWRRAWLVQSTRVRLGGLPGLQAQEIRRNDQVQHAGIVSRVVGHFGDKSFHAINCSGTDNQTITKRKYTKHKITNATSNKLALVITQSTHKLIQSFLRITCTIWPRWYSLVDLLDRPYSVIRLIDIAGVTRTFDTGLGAGREFGGAASPVQDPHLNTWLVFVCVFFRVKDSLRYLVQDSLSNFTQMVVDACHTTMQCDDSMEWGSDVINSPYKSAIILLMSRLHVKWNYFTIISAFVDVWADWEIILFQRVETCRKLFQNYFTGLLQLTNIFQRVQCRWNNFSDTEILFQFQTCLRVK